MKNVSLVGLLFALACGGISSDESDEVVEYGEVEQAYEIATSSSSPKFMLGARRANNSKSLQRCSVSLCGTGLSNRVVVPRTPFFTIGMSTTGGVGQQLKSQAQNFCLESNALAITSCSVTDTCTSANLVCLGDDSSFFDSGSQGTSSVRRWGGARCSNGSVQQGITFAGKTFDVEVCSRYTVGVSMTRMNAQALSAGQKLELQRRVVYNALLQTVGLGYDTAASGTHLSRDTMPALSGTIPTLSVSSGERCRAQNTNSSSGTVSFFDAGCANN